MTEDEKARVRWALRLIAEALVAVKAAMAAGDAINLATRLAAFAAECERALSRAEPQPALRNSHLDPAPDPVLANVDHRKPGSAGRNMLVFNHTPFPEDGPDFRGT